MCPNCPAWVLEKFTSRLTQLRLLCHRDLRSLTKYQLILSRQQFRSNPPPQVQVAQHGALEGDFALCISLYHGYELLMQMGLRSLYLFMQGIMGGGKETARARSELQRSIDFMDLYKEMEAMFVRPATGPDEAFFYSHPKLQKLDEVVLKHFQSWSDTAGSEGAGQAVSTRVMIFSSFRESVQEIATMLNRHQPLVKVMTFMGQASAGKGVRGFTQKEQLEVVRQFKEGGFNTIVSTCVGEEGLDIGEVDLIVCFDAQKSPIRLVQRMGRTGRRRQGRIVVILAQGREERTYNQSQSNRRSVNRSILESSSSFHMFPSSPRMLPEGLTPTIHKMHITCGQFEAKDLSRRSSKGRKSIAEGRESLVHPGALVPEDSQRKDGFLSPAEFSLWSSTMRLGEDEPQPTLPRPHFLSLSTDGSPQREEAVDGSKRELSLWEWRHWQNRPQYTHRVGHSDRCLHFTAIMDLIDNLKQEEETPGGQGECSYEAELMQHLHKEDVAGLQVQKQRGKHAKRQKETKLGPTKQRKNTKSSHAASFSEDLDVDTVDLKKPKVALASPWTTFKEVAPPETVPVVRHDDKGPENQSQRSTVSYNQLMDMDYACIFHSDEDGSPVKKPLQEEAEVSMGGVDSMDEKAQRTKSSFSPCHEELAEEQDSEFEELFYFPKCNKKSRIKPIIESSPNLIRILENVKQLLSKSPPLTVDLELCQTLPPSHEITRASKEVELDLLHEDDPFQVNFCLEANDDDVDDESMEVESVKNDDEEIPARSPNFNETSHSSSLQNNAAEHSREMTNSPNWDEVFEGEKEDGGLEYKGAEDNKPPQCLEQVDKRGSLQQSILNESVDLFGDDEAFLQITLPDIQTPDKNFSNHTEGELVEVKDDDAEANKHTAEIISVAPADSLRTSRTLTPIVQQNPVQSSEQFDLSQDFFSVNFDLGYCLEDDDEDEVEVKDNLQSAPALPSAPKLESESSNPSHKPKYTFSTPTRPHPVSISTPSSYPKQNKDETSAPSPKDNSFLSPSLTLQQRLALKSKTSTPSYVTVASGHRPPETIMPKWGLDTPERESPRTSSKKTTLQKALLPAERSANFPMPEHPVSDSEDDVVMRKRGRQGQLNPLSSPEQSKVLSDVDSPVQVTRKRVVARCNFMSDESDVEAKSDDDFQDTSLRQAHVPVAHKRSHKHSHATHSSKATARRRGRQFLDEEAELSEEDGPVSSDEDDDEEQNRMLEGFVVDNSHLSQGLNDSEMQGIYLKSVRSPALPAKYKMLYKPNNSMDIFSQVPEQDESYGEDSFVVYGSDVEELGDEGEEEEEQEEDLVQLIGEDSFVDGRKNYATRRKVQQSRARGREAIPKPGPAEKPKRSRIVRVVDSSDEEQEESGRRTTGAPKRTAPLCPQAAKEKQPPLPPSPAFKAPMLPAQPSAVCKPASHRSSSGTDPLEERNRQRFQNQARLSDELDFDVTPSTPSLHNKSQAGSSTVCVDRDRDLAPCAGPSPSATGLVCVLVDSRCISSGPEVVSTLRLRHSVTAQVCSLDGCDFVVSNRMAVERQTQAEVAAAQNRKRLLERMHSLQSLFERVCLIVEADRTRPGEASRPFQRTRYYDSTLGGLVRAGVRLLTSGGAEETAALLAELARVEQRKGQAISVPLEVKGQQQQQALQFYLTLPCVSYVNALNMCHNFRTVAQLVNSSVEALQKGAHVSRSRAEEIYRCLRYSSDISLMATR
ncbi:hypothetical protein ACEWY4_005165 [Coilia grayii]|uniref:Helicase C-terminal domain-containing protein n=1 Tax=Coilia grayii TaxID=363190 RepID=A0ABD1KHS6_9TELE